MKWYNKLEIAYKVLLLISCISIMPIALITENEILSMILVVILLPLLIICIGLLIWVIIKELLEGF